MVSDCTYNNTSLFDEIVSKAERKADKIVLEAYKEILERMKSENENILDWNFKTQQGIITKEIDSYSMSRKVEREGFFNNFKRETAVLIRMKHRFKMPKPSISPEQKFKILNAIGKNLEYREEDKPEYEIILELVFNSSGKKANTAVADAKNGNRIVYLSASQSFRTGIQKLNKLKDIELLQIHDVLYVDWVKKQEKHPYKGRFIAETYGL